ncbi:MAG: IS21 family transposase [Acidimicrobiales bacterium]
MISVEDWAEVRRLHFAEGKAIKVIARELGLARNTVRAAVRSADPPRYERKAVGSAVDVVEPEIRRLLLLEPSMPATVIAERIGWDRSMTVLKDRVRELRPLFLPADPVQRMTYRPGELAQWDLWFPPVDIAVSPAQRARPPVIVGVSGFSRFIVACMIPSKESADVLGGHLAGLVQLGGVPRKGVYDGEPAFSVRREGRVVLTDAFQAFRGTLGMGAYVCRPADPEAKGLVERANKFLETSFLPGRHFDGPDGFNEQLSCWLERVNGRVHATLRQRPSELVVADRAAMLPLPPVLPDPSLRWTVRVGRDHYVRAGTCDYSIHPKAIGRRVDVRLDLTEFVATAGGEVVARHARAWGRHQVLTDPVHVAAREQQRRQRTPVIAQDAEVEERDLSVYDGLGAA